jgi:predicted  nucleic acid-binding Zn-ribbon protein
MALRTKERTQESAKSLTRAKAVHIGAAHTPAIPLDIASLLGPYRKHGRLALRIEQMPQTSRMSHGRNNGDRSWSIAEHELNDLSYHLPEGAVDDHALMVRVVGLDQDGATLAVLSIPISVNAVQPSSARSATPIPFASAANDTDRISDRSIDTATLEKRAAENLERARAEWQREAGENLARAQAALKAEHAAQMSALESRWKEEFSRIKAETAAMAKQNEKPQAEKVLSAPPDPKVLSRLRDALASLTEDLASRNTALADAQAEIARLDGERETLRRELSRAHAETTKRPEPGEIQKLHDALNSAEANLASRDADLAGALAQIARQQTEFAQLNAELARARTNASAEPDSGELQRLQDAIKYAEAKLASREAEFKRLRGELTQARADAAARPDAAEVRKLEEAMKSTERNLAGREANLADALARVSRQETEIAELRAELIGAQRDAAAKPSEDELRRVQETLALAQTDLSSRDTALTEARLQIEKYGADTERLRAELAAAQSAGATKESALVEQSERLRAELAAAQATIASHETTTADLRKNLALSEDRWRKHADEALAKAKAEWEKSYSARLAAAETSARTLQSQCHEMEAQLRASEAVLADVRRRNAQSDATHHESDDTADLRAQLCALQVAFAERESELAKMRMLPGENRRYDDDTIVLRSNRVIEGLDERSGKRARPLALDLAIVAAVCIAVVFYLPRIESLLPDSWVYAINSTVYDVQTALGAQPAATAAAAPATSAAPPALPHSTILRTANVHTGPKASDTIAFTLQHGTEVDVVEHHGNWVHVRAVSKGAQPQEGWVFNTFLQNNKDSTPAK